MAGKSRKGAKETASELNAVAGALTGDKNAEAMAREYGVDPNAGGWESVRIPRTANRDLYSQSVFQAFHRPVISADAAATYLANVAKASGMSLDVALVSKALAEQHKDHGGYLSMQHVQRERALLQIGAQYREAVASGTMSQDAAAATMSQLAKVLRTTTANTVQEKAVMQHLDGTRPQTDAPEYGIAKELRGLVQANAPGGEYAKQGFRSESEDRALHEAHGDDAYHMVNADTRQNLEAQRVAELLSANDKEYAPATAWSQGFRALGNAFGPVVNAVRNVTTEPGVLSSGRFGENADDFYLMQEPDGKYKYAAQVWDRGEAERGTPNDQNNYDANGRAKYLTHDPVTPQGLGEMTQINTSFPVARGYANLADFAEAPMRLGWNSAGGNIDASAIRDARLSFNQTNPVLPEGMSQKEGVVTKGLLDDADTKADGWISAKLGPMRSDAINYVLGTKGRSYLSGLESAVLETPGEMFRDPVNLAVNLTMGPIAGAARGTVLGGLGGMAYSSAGAGAKRLALNAAKTAGRMAAKGAASGSKKLVTNVADDFVEESLFENPAIGGSTEGWGYFAPEKTNLLMGDKSPNDPDYDAKLEQNTQNFLEGRQQVSDSMKRARGRQR